MSSNNTKELRDKCRIITPEFRVAYPHVFNPQAPSPDDKPKYSITMMFPKNKELTGSTVSGEPISFKQVMLNAMLVEYGTQQNIPRDLASIFKWGDASSPIGDGDSPKHDSKIGFKDHYIIRASAPATSRPGLIDASNVPISDPALFYPGCYARAYISAYFYFYPDRNRPMKKGITFTLDHVQKTRDGEPIGGKVSADKVFKPLQAPSDEVSFGAEEEGGFF